MVTLNEMRNYGANRNVLSIMGLSTDIKPIDVCEGMTITNGSSFYCMDTKTVFLFDEENKTWYEQ